MQASFSGRVSSTRNSTIRCSRAPSQMASSSSRQLSTRVSALMATGATLLKSRSHYQVLGVPTTASAIDIKTAYRTKARQLHPDVSKHPSADALFMECTRAYETLSCTTTRTRYDATIVPARNSFFQSDLDIMNQDTASYSSPRPTPSSRPAAAPTAGNWSNSYRATSTAASKPASSSFSASAYSFSQPWGNHRADAYRPAENADDCYSEGCEPWQLYELAAREQAKKTSSKKRWF